MKQIIKEYEIITDLTQTKNIARGYSLSPKGLISHIFEDNSAPIQLLDIGFGAGDLGRYIKEQEHLCHWSIDGVDDFEPNCNNTSLFNEGIYGMVLRKRYHLIN